MSFAFEIKIEEYAGVEQLWMVQLSDGTITVYTTANDWHVFRAGDSIEAGNVLPGWTVNVTELFAKLEARS